MKVLFVVPSISRTGGGVSEAVRLTNEAVRALPEVTTEIWAFEDSESARDVNAFVPSRVRLFQAWPPARFDFSPSLLLALLRSDADIVHVHGLWMFHCAAVLIWSLLSGRPYVVTPHGMLEAWILDRSPRLKAIVSRLFHDNFLRHASCLQALTKKEAEDIWAVVPNAPIRVIPNYVNIEYSISEVRPIWWNKDLEGRAIFLFFGRIHEKKGCSELLEAWAALCSRDPVFRDRSALVFCGWMDSLHGFLEMVEQVSALHRNVVYGGPQFGRDKQRTLDAATFVILPSRSEGLPMTVLEAWAAGKPVLMTDACNLQIGFEKGAAIRIDLEVSRLAPQLRAAYDLTEKERATMRSNATALIDLVFSRQNVAKALFEMYVAAMSLPKGQPCDAA
jgi:glycosyltransferase involved in cell wall biosynthesis